MPTGSRAGLVRSNGRLEGDREPVPGVDGDDRIEALFALSCGARILRMHVEAVGAPVDLGRSSLEQMEQTVIESAFSQVRLELKQWRKALRRLLVVIEPGCHELLLADRLLPAVARFARRGDDTADRACTH
jgi:hypothetical protein